MQHVGVADTIGVGTPRKVQRGAWRRALKHYELDDISGHFHDTYGQALGNTLACLEMGVWQFDTSSAGLGGCPYAKGATGNVATEDVVYMLHGMGIETGIDLDKLIDAGAYISDALGRKPISRAAHGHPEQASGEASMCERLQLDALPEGVQRVGARAAGARPSACAAYARRRRRAPRSRRPTRWASPSARSPRASSSAASPTTRRCWSSPRATAASTRRRSMRWSARPAAPMPSS